MLHPCLSNPFQSRNGTSTFVLLLYMDLTNPVRGLVGRQGGVDEADRRAEAEPVAQEPRRAQQLDDAPEGRPGRARPARRAAQEGTARTQGQAEDDTLC